MVQNHGIFQGHYFFHHIGLDRNMRDHFRGHPHFEHTARVLRALRQPGLRPEGRDAADLASSSRCCARVMAQPRQSIYKAALQREAAA